MCRDTDTSITGGLSSRQFISASRDSETPIPLSLISTSTPPLLSSCADTCTWVSLGENIVAFSTSSASRCTTSDTAGPMTAIPGWMLSDTLLYCSISEVAARATSASATGSLHLRALSWPASSSRFSELRRMRVTRWSNLFSMDHLVTRMRRNSENLLLLAGHESARKWSEPVPLADVARAATSEIEQYSRVTLNIQPGVAVVGPAVSDVVHLLAELVENATMFSPKDTQVLVSAQELSSGGVLIEVNDKGIGVSESRLAEMNWRLDNPPVIDVSVSRHMGLFAVARLAERHRIRIRLRPATPQGMTALVWLPDSVIERTSRVFSGAGTWSQSIAAHGSSLLTRRASFQQGVGRRGIGTRSVKDGQDAMPVPAQSGQVGAGRGGNLGEAVPAASHPVSNWFRTHQPSPGSSGPPTGDGTTGSAPAGTGNGTGAQTPAEGGTAVGNGHGTGAVDSSQPSGSPVQPARAPGAPVAAGWGAATAGSSSGRNPADIVADPVLGDQTAAGLPMRVPQANLIPGSPPAAPLGGGWAAGGPWDQGSPAGQPAARSGSAAQPMSAPLPRSADLARSRLSGFQRGARRADSQAHHAEDGADR